MSKVSFGLIGFGRIGKRHAAIITNHPECELVAIVDKDPEVINDIEYNSDVAFYPSLEKMYKEQMPDVLSVCSPNGLHLMHATAAIRNGSDVIIEKPMGLSYRACLDLITEANALNRKLFVVKQNRYSPPVKWIKDLVLNGDLGKIYLVQINCFWNRSDQYYEDSSWKGKLKMDGGVLFTQFSHFIDIMYWIFGDIEDISGMSDNFGHKTSTEFNDSGVATFRFFSGGLGALQFTTAVWDQNMESAIRIVAEKGSIVLGGQYMNEIKHANIDGIPFPDLPETSPPNQYGKYSGSAANHHFVIQNVVDVLKGISEPTTRSEDGAKVVGIIERINKAISS